MAFTLPKTITPGQNENGSDVQANDAALRDELNGVTTVSDVLHKSDTSAQSVAGNFTVAGSGGSFPNYEYAFSRYKDLFGVSARGITSAAASKYFFQPSGSPPVLSPSTSTFNVGPIRYLDPADRTAGTRANYYRVRAWCSQNATANNVTLTVGLYPVTFAAGTAGNPNTYTLGTVVAGSTVAFASGASGQVQSNSGDFAAPSAGYYAIGLTSSGSQAGNALSDIDAVLQYRQA